MGCRSSKAADAATISRWRSTGIVALRDSKLKAFPFYFFPNIFRNLIRRQLTFSFIEFSFF